jgi:hypothetical protein
LSAQENEIWAAKLKAAEGAVGEIKAILSIVYRVRLPLGFFFGGLQLPDAPSLGSHCFFARKPL